ncbi:MAG: hypothetical protein ABII76_18510 [Pseudomonadota bacterium]
MEATPHTRRILVNRSMEMTEPNPFDHAAIIRVTRSDSGAVIADLVDALETARRQIVLFGRDTDSIHVAVLEQIDAALSKARGE